MKTSTLTCLLAALAAALLLGACSAPEAASPPAPQLSGPAEEDVAPELTEPLAPSETPAGEEPAPGLVPEEGKTTLLVYAGEARFSRDSGKSWSYADTGLWLETDDRLQVAKGGLALILFPDGSLIRLEGFADFKLVLNEFDFEGGTKRVIGQVWEGTALVDTAPLPTRDSRFQLWAMTALIDLAYDSTRSVPLDAGDQLSEEDRIAFGALISEEAEGEILFSYSPLARLYSLEKIDGDTVLIQTTPRQGEIAQWEIPFRDDLEDEFELEGLLDVAAALVDLDKTASSPQDLDVYGFSMIAEGEPSEGQALYSVFDIAELDEFLEEAADLEEKAEYARYVSSTPAYSRYKLYYRYYMRIPDIFSPEILMQLEKYNLGCDITTGLGCAVPEGCDRESGEGCAFTSGCNIITREGCAAPRLSCIVYTNCDWMPCGAKPVIEHFCRPRVRAYCDPGLAGDCDQYLTSPLLAELVQNPELAGQPLGDPNDQASLAAFYDQSFWDSQTEFLGDGYEDDEDDEEIEWCTCTASVPPGYPPPPPGMDMTYRCWCTDPGAVRD